MRKVNLALVLGILFNTFFYNALAQQLNTAKLDSFFNVLNANNQAMGSFIIAINGRPLYQKVIGYSKVDGNDKTPATFTTRYRIGSITKTFTAAMIFQLIDEKKLSLDTKLAKFFPEIPYAEGITMANLLSHTSGLSDYVNENRDWITDAHSRKQLLDTIANVKPHFEPGAKQQYSNGGYLLLGYIIEKITGKTYQEALRQRIVNKIGLKNTIAGTINSSQKQEGRSYSFNGSWIPVKDIYFPNVIAVGDILSTPQDLVTFINALHSGKLVSPASYKQMKSFEGSRRFGMGLIKAHFNEKTLIGHNGGTYGSYSAMYILPEEGISFALTTNGMNYKVNDILLTLLSAHYHLPYSIPFQVRSESLDKLLGNYTSVEMPLKISVSKKGSTLIAQATGQEAFPLEAINDDTFKREQFDVLLKFDRTKREMTLVQGGKSYNYTLQN